MIVAQVGPMTAVLEDAAMAIAAGAVIGSSAIGVLGLVLGWPRGALERRALSDSYSGGAVGALVAILDVLLRDVV